MAERYRASDFDYEFPPDAVAQYPLDDRSASRLLVLDRHTGTVTHRRFREFPTLLEPGDVVVLNTSRVIPARLLGVRENGRAAEILLVHPEPEDTWLVMGHPGGKLKPSRVVRFGDDARCEILEMLGGGLRRVRFTGRLDVDALMERYGSTPLPPYIHRAPEPDDRERYQTVYAARRGSVAAPTAGLHFTRELLEAMRDQGVRIVETVLHVGPGTFKPVEVEDPAEHRMHAEWYEVSEETAEAVSRAKAAGRRVWAVGTTVARTLETAAGRLGPALKGGLGQEPRPEGRHAPVVAVRPGAGWTDLFIYPPYEFRVVDALLTNFHLPRSTLIMLVAAFAGYEHTMDAYRQAVEQGYRLFSYGDAMAIV